MAAPLVHHLIPDPNDPSQVPRQIDNHYHLQMVAENTRQIFDYQSRVLTLQHKAALANLSGLYTISQRQSEGNHLLSRLLGGLDRLDTSMEELNATAQNTLHAINAQTEILRNELQNVADRLMEQRRILADIAHVLRAPHETNALELLREADRALRTGMLSSGREKKKNSKTLHTSLAWCATTL